MSSIDRIVDAVVAQGRGDHPALVLEDGSVLSYAELAERIDAAAQALAAAGLAPASAWCWSARTAPTWWWRCSPASERAAGRCR